MSVVNAGVVRGRLELENEFGDTLADFNRQMSAAKTESKETATAVKGVDSSLSEFKRSIHESAAGMADWARKQIDAEDAANALGAAVKDSAKVTEQLGKEVDETTTATRKLSQEEKQLANEAR